ncbi:hypothetical protein [Sporanaerobacter acetigenes]|uniref:Uncharacterized protein n=1 Tax=Sporanaerobacter acetigenes DSM 13106 TaxID=1123281 RepID=A0A1M5UNK0_9FIRM|nr:hypothetical protein [Sporanaerobacter acetigenes]SHH64500.1 hypothetical protein SAMN02745180_00707 [Sporanaerobacter acetigenes DSM 13106]
MEQRFVVITNNNFSQPMSRENAIKMVKEYDKKGIDGYIVSEDEAKRIKTPENFNEPKWD